MSYIEEYGCAVYDIHLYTHLIKYVIVEMMNQDIYHCILYMISSYISIHIKPILDSELMNFLIIYE
jgi:hypothetical protein